jgi:hypothetical protein
MKVENTLAYYEMELVIAIKILYNTCRFTENFLIKLKNFFLGHLNKTKLAAFMPSSVLAITASCIITENLCKEHYVLIILN